MLKVKFHELNPVEDNKSIQKLLVLMNCQILK